MSELSRYKFILASTSPRRRQFLEILGLSFVVIPPGAATKGGEIDETPQPGEAPDSLVQRLSRLKARAVADNLAQLWPTSARTGQDTAIIIAADTIVVANDQILGKPKDAAEALHILKRLRLQPHFVYSGLTVAYCPLAASIPTDSAYRLATRLHKSRVWMRPYTDIEIADYIKSGSPLDKAGAYGIQDRPFRPVAKLEGCFASVIGLPLGELAQILTQFNIPLPRLGTICQQHINAPCCQIPAQ